MSLYGAKIKKNHPHCHEILESHIVKYCVCQIWGWGGVCLQWGNTSAIYTLQESLRFS